MAAPPMARRAPGLRLRPYLVHRQRVVGARPADAGGDEGLVCAPGEVAGVAGVGLRDVEDLGVRDDVPVRLDDRRVVQVLPHSRGRHSAAV